MAEVLCRHFNGYKPCRLNTNCSEQCPTRSIPSTRILLIHLDAMGAVLRSTSILKAIHRKYPNAHITWVTRPRTKDLLINNPLIDRIIEVNTDGILELSALDFDVALVVDKSLVAAGLLRNVRVKEVYGFRTEKHTGSIVPATLAAQELWEIGLSNEKKFFQNQKPETQLITEALELEYRRDPYTVCLTDKEQSEANNRRRDWLMHSKVLVGINTGCSNIMPYKKLTINAHRELIMKLKKLCDIKIVLLGGPEDTKRNQEIAYGMPVTLTPTDAGLRDGLISTSACDIIVTGDSLGMHMGIALEKWTVAWFGPTCAQEIDLYDRGVKVITKAACSPCWLRSCHKETMCYDQVDLNELVEGVEKGIEWITSSSKQHLSVTPYSPSP